MSSLSVSVAAPIANTTLTDNDFTLPVLSLNKGRKALNAITCLPIIGHFVGYTHHFLLYKKISKLNAKIEGLKSQIGELPEDPASNDALEQARRQALDLLDASYQASHALRWNRRCLEVCNLITAVAYGVIATIGTTLVSAPVLLSFAALSFFVLFTYAERDVDSHDNDSEKYRDKMDWFKNQRPIDRAPTVEDFTPEGVKVVYETQAR